MSTLKSLFKTKEPTTTNTSLELTKFNEDRIPEIDQGEKDWVEFGYRQAGKNGGSVSAYRVHLPRIYVSFKRQLSEDERRQRELKEPIQREYDNKKSEIEKVESKIKEIEDNQIAFHENEIRSYKGEIQKARENPIGVLEEEEGRHSGRVGLIISAIILIFLTIYLFIFYSSASYSAFFKQFTLNELGVANSIFDPQAIKNAFLAGVTELILILTIPFVFIGLGYLIHKFQEAKGIQKYFKIFFLILITFLFDSILAYEITEKIYNIKRDNSFDEMPPYTIAMAFQAVNFWLIIFAGFVVYLIWGFVFDFFMLAQGQRDSIATYIKERLKLIRECEIHIKEKRKVISNLTQEISQLNSECISLAKRLENLILPISEVEHDFAHFTSGWVNYLSAGGGYSDNDVQEIRKELELFKQEIINRDDF